MGYKDEFAKPAGIILLVLGMALSLLWPAYINGGPFWFPDTSNYIRAADAGVVFLTGSTSEWSDRLVINEEERDADGVGVGVLNHSHAEVTPTRPVLSGRSIYYGFLIYLPMRIAGPWGAIILQALLVAGSLVFCGRVVLKQIPHVRLKASLSLAGAIITLTPLPFFTSMLMPDVYSGLLVAALAVSTVLWPRLKCLERIVLVGTACLIATFHTTNVLLAVCVSLTALLVRAIAARGFSRSVWPPVMISLPVVLSGAGSAALFAVAVASALGSEPISPPFLSARITAAGPGIAYLDQACANNPSKWELCNQRARLPQWSDSFLWSQAQGTGVFQLASPEQQVRMAREDKEFFLAVLVHDPLAVAEASLHSTGQQLVRFSLLEFNYPPLDGDELITKYPAPIVDYIATTRAAKGTMPTHFTIWATALTSAAGVLVVIWALIFKRRRGFIVLSQTNQLALLLLIGVLSNAAICGSFSGPHPRYQMRLIWLIQLAACLALVNVSTVPQRQAIDR